MRLIPDVSCDEFMSACGASRISRIAPDCDRPADNRCVQRVDVMAQTVTGRHVRGFDPIPNIVSLVLTGWIFGPLLFSFAERGLRSPSTTLVDCDA